MAMCTLAGLSVLRGWVRMPRLGVWHADLEVDAQDLAGLRGRIELQLGDGLTMRGVCWRSGVTQDTVFARMVGGAGGLAKVCTPKSYQSVPLRSPLTDVLATAGEILSDSADAAVLATPLQKWSILQRAASLELAHLAEKAPEESAWRMLADGTVWLGVETWPVVSADFELIRAEPHLFRAELGVESPTIVPGVTLEGGRVSYVVHELLPERIRTSLWMEDA